MPRLGFFGVPAFLLGDSGGSPELLRAALLLGGVRGGIGAASGLSADHGVRAMPVGDFGEFRLTGAYFLFGRNDLLCCRLRGASSSSSASPPMSLRHRLTKYSPPQQREVQTKTSAMMYTGWMAVASTNFA
eukprot:CAMPEP_0118885130 /NCGR_PEP_ID=MMETSP1163-20130328/23713_1 /TAXON_ID=124430 /ORGANISM="Phaeomonas parva, Strain CCMP2877" /LENGTH=130 /DNA_ID=CAMNT_0006823081 /DNA_START=381 /DNA_END=773 /DNA_ORIENTATION=-